MDEEEPRRSGRKRVSTKRLLVEMEEEEETEATVKKIEESTAEEGKRFKLMKTVELAVVVGGEQEQNQKKTWTCEDCGVVFGYAQNLRKHKDWGRCKGPMSKKRLLKGVTPVAKKSTNFGVVVKRYSCTKCSASYRWPQGLCRHKKLGCRPRPKINVGGPLVVAVPNEKWRCGECGGDFVSRKTLSRHLNIPGRCARMKKILQGQGQGEGTTKKKRFEVITPNKKIATVGLRLHVCDICGFKFKWRNNLTRHLIKGRCTPPKEKETVEMLPTPSTSLGMKWICEDCGTTFSSAGNLNKHNRYRRCKAAAGEVTPTPAPVVKVAEEKVTQKLDMDEEKKTGRKAEAIKCPQCKVTFYSQRKLDLHQSMGRCSNQEKTVAVVPVVASKSPGFRVAAEPLEKRIPIKCPKCETVFLEERYLRRHLQEARCRGKGVSNNQRRKNGAKNKKLKRKIVKPLQPPVALTPVPVQASPKKKMEKSSSGKAVWCGECKMAFDSRSKLRFHLTLDHQRKIYYCRQCPAWFSRKDRLAPHIQEKHLQGPPPPPGGNKEDTDPGFVCGRCRNAYLTEAALEQHKASRHPSPKKVDKPKAPAEPAPKKFTPKQRTPQARKSNQNWSICKLCHVNFPNRALYRKHLEGVHRRKILSCRWCPGVWFTKKGRWTNHLEEMHPDKMADEPQQKPEKSVKVAKKGGKKMPALAKVKEEEKVEQEAEEIEEAEEAGRIPRATLNNVLAGTALLQQRLGELARERQQQQPIDWFYTLGRYNPEETG